MNFLTKDQIVQRLLDRGVVAIIRADHSEQLIDASQALIEGGIDAIEITMTTPNALQVIADARKKFGREILLGVGSVLDVATARQAIEAGAEYVVTPVLRPEVIAYCREKEKPIASGSYSPTEAQVSHELGADFIKIFPADGLGPKYMSALLGPLPHLRIIPTGGVDAGTAGAFIKAGCVAVAAGSSLVSREILRSRDWVKLTAAARALIGAVEAARKEKRA
jgi:2-dehydro-3-deoxyphosphogluconate aldolase/(4S)-4-hydroxy-2-oxoglutarate aldolase